MSVLDKFLDAMHLNDDMDVDDDEFLDEDTSDSDLFESRPGRRLIRRKDDPDDEFPAPAPAPAAAPAAVKKPAKEKKSFLGSSRTRSDNPRKTAYQEDAARSPKVSAFRPRRTEPEEEEETNNYSVCVIRPKSMEDALEIARTLVSNCVVILNLEGLDLDVSQRLFDFASGSCCALQGRLDKISNYIFVLTPRGINISGEFQEIITGTFDADDVSDEEDY